METPKRPKLSGHYDSPNGTFTFQLPSAAGMLFGAGEVEDRILLKGAERVGLALWHE